MESRDWRIVLIALFVLFVAGLISCGSISDLATTAPQPEPTPKLSQPTATEQATPFPQPSPLLTSSPVTYPHPGISPSPVPSNTPTVYLASIQTLSPPEWGTIAAQLSITPTDDYTPAPITPHGTPNTPLVPQHYLRTTFVDRNHGWIAGYADWEERAVDALASTSDGGRTWHAIPVPPVSEIFLSPPSIVGNFYRMRLLFTDAQNGWIYQKKLFHTNDGGQTWRQEHPRGTIIQMRKATDGTFWALEQAGSDQTLWRVSGDSYTSWIKLGYQFPIVMNQVYLAVIDDQHAWMSYWVTFQMGDPNAGSHLYRTSDGGKNWELVTPPEPCNFYPLMVSPVDSQELWMGCGFPFVNAAFESPDGGESWYERQRGEWGSFSGITALSKSFVYMTYIRSTSITITHDAGETWVESPMDCKFENAMAFFIDESYGWAACDSSINLTVDGGRTWELVQLSGN